MRATLYILGGRSVGRSFVVEDSAVIGREPSCQIRLGDKSISRRHARIMWDGFRWHVEDLDSRNGVHVDKQRVQQANLADCDEFVLGEVPVRLRIEAEISADEEQDFEFEDDFLSQPAPLPARESEAPGIPEIAAEDEIVLEEEIDLSASTGSAVPAGLELSRRPGGASAAPAPAQRAPIRVQAPPSRLHKDLDPRAKLLAQSSRKGFLAGDLSQQPGWVLGLLFLMLGIMMLGLAYLVFSIVQSLGA